MKKQYVIQKYVMANSVEEAVKKSRKIPIHEVFIHSQWFDKVGSTFYVTEPEPIGLKQK